jgi:hypothetical protein
MFTFYSIKTSCCLHQEKKMENKGTKMIGVKDIDVPQALFNQVAQQATVLLFQGCNFGELTISEHQRVEMRECTWKNILVEDRGTLVVAPDRLLESIHNVRAKGEHAQVVFLNPKAEVLIERSVHYDEGPSYKISGFSKVEFLDHSVIKKDIEFVNQAEAQVYFDDSSTFTGKLINGRRVTKKWE